MHRFFDGGEYERGGLPVDPVGPRLFVRVSGAWVAAFAWQRIGGVWKTVNVWANAAGAWRGR